jgi:hypothetical protein
MDDIKELPTLYDHQIVELPDGGWRTGVFIADPITRELGYVYQDYQSRKGAEADLDAFIAAALVEFEAA